MSDVINRGEANGINYWAQVAEQQKLLEKALVGMPWQSKTLIFMQDNGRLLPGMNPNPRVKGTVSEVGSIKKAAELIMIGNHELCTEAEVMAYKSDQDRKRAEAVSFQAAKRGTVTFAPPTSASSDQGEIEMLKKRLLALEGK